MRQVGPEKVYIIHITEASWDCMTTKAFTSACFQKAKMSGLLQVLVLAVLIPLVHSSDYSGEVTCSPHYCIAGRASCEYDRCVCNNPPYSWGHGDFACYRHNTVAAEVKNDPQLTTFNNETVKFQDPCRYLLTSVKQELKNKYGTKIGYCYFNVHAYHKRIKGKIVVDGIEIAVRFEIGYGTHKELSVNTYGQEGHVVLEGSDDDYLEYGPYGHDLSHGPEIYSDPHNNIHVKRYYNAPSRQYVFEIDSCGFRSTFVPYDVEHGIHSPFIPGISVAVNCAYHPEWLRTDKVMALPPAKKGVPTIASLAHELGLTPEQAVAYRAFTSHIEQTQPSKCNRCSSIAHSLETCDSYELAKAFDQCYWILDTPHFIRCVSDKYPDTSSEEHLTFFATCVEHFCGGYSRCHELRDTSCHDSRLAHILSTTCY